MKATVLSLIFALLAPAGARAAWLDEALPQRASRSGDFYSAFSRGVYERETGFAGGAFQGCGAEGACGFQTSSSWLLGNQARLVSRAAEAALRAQYALDEWSQAWLGRPWDTQKATMAAVVGGALLYTDGLHFHQEAAGWSVRGTVAPARRMRSEGSRLATMELGRKGAPLSLWAAWGRTAPAVGARYALRY